MEQAEDDLRKIDIPTINEKDGKRQKGVEKNSR